ncbi:MAG: 3-dehydroquinate synthase, partial [Sphingobacterium sp.]
MIKAINSLGYAVVFDDQLAGLRDFLQEHSYSQLLILVDRNTNDHCLPVLQAAIPEMIDYDIIEIDPGEENKNIDY